MDNTKHKHKPGRAILRLLPGRGFVSPAKTTVGTESRNRQTPRAPRYASKESGVEILHQELPQIKTIVSYETREITQTDVVSGQMMTVPVTVKVTRQVRVTRQKLRVNRRVLERRKWVKFGAVQGIASGPEPIVTSVAVNQSIDLSTLQPLQHQQGDVLGNNNSDGISRQQTRQNGGRGDVKRAGYAAAATPAGGAQEQQTFKSLIRCRNCGQVGHFTSTCPNGKIDVAAVAAVPAALGAGQNPAIADAAQTFASAAAAGASKVYKPPSRRLQGSSPGAVAAKDKEGEVCALRVSNVSDETTEDDLRALFRSFGEVRRIYLARDRQTNRPRGFAFVNYVTQTSAQQAIERLNGYGYDNLILRVEWAKARE